MIQARAELDIGDAVLRSHAIGADAAEAAARGDREGFIEVRERDLKRVVEDFLVDVTRFGYGDRPTVEHILADVAAASE